MARGRHRVKIAVRVPFVKAEWEWIGFASGGAFGNLDTVTIHEIIPPIADNTVGIQSFTVHRIVGNIHIRQQSGVVTASALGIAIGVEGAGEDQTSDDPLDGLTTDVDHLAHKGTMFRWQGAPMYTTAIADADLVPWALPIDLKVKRIVDKRARLVITIQANNTARLQAAVNVRALIREAAGS